MVSFRGHSQYLATWAKMTPWQIDCKMPSMRMGALIGTSVCAASDSEDIMGVDVGRLVSCDDSLIIHLQSWSGPSDTDDQPETKHDEAQATRFPPIPGLKSCPRAVSHARAERHYWPFNGDEGQREECCRVAHSTRWILSVALLPL